MSTIHGFLTTLLLLTLGASQVMAADESRLEVVVVGGTHAAGEPIVLQVTYINPTAQKLGFISKKGADVIEEFQIDVTGPTEKPLGKTAFFQAMIDAKKARLLDNGSTIIREVEPNKPLKRELLFSLFYDCTAEGEYNGRVTTLNVKDADGKVVPLSGTFKFTIATPH